MAKRILIVDDAVFMRMKLKDILEKNGYEVAGEAQNGQEAFDKYQAEKPDLVTMRSSQVPLTSSLSRSIRNALSSPWTKRFLNDLEMILCR